MGKQQTWRPGSAAPTLDDVRQAYRRLNELDARLAQMHADMHILATRIDANRQQIGMLLGAVNSLITVMCPTEAERLAREQAKR